jgi:hypothetical protein
LAAILSSDSNFIVIVNIGNKSVSSHGMIGMVGIKTETVYFAGLLQNGS